MAISTDKRFVFGRMCVRGIWMYVWLLFWVLSERGAGEWIDMCKSFKYTRVLDLLGKWSSLDQVYRFPVEKYELVNELYAIDLVTIE